MLQKKEVIELLNRYSQSIGHGEEVITESQFDYVADKICQLDLQVSQPSELSLERKKVLEIIEREPEFTDEMPEEMKIALSLNGITDFELVKVMLQMSVKLTKENITKAILAL